MCVCLCVFACVCVCVCVQCKVHVCGVRVDMKTKGPAADSDSA